METILAIQSSVLSTPESFFRTTAEYVFHELLVSQNLWFGPRKPLETNYDFRQIIPYTLLKYGDKYVSYERTKKGGESRLHNLRSLGIGGHINTTDIYYYPTDPETIDIQSTLTHAIAREIQEELICSPMYDKLDIVGCICSSHTDVDRVHLGVVVVIPLSSDSIISHISHVTKVACVNPVESMTMIDHTYESWSQIVIKQYLTDPQLSFKF